MILLGIVLCFVSAIFCAVALVGARTEGKKEMNAASIWAPSIVLFAVLPLFLLRRVVQEWPRLSIYSFSVLISIAATIAAAFVLVPLVAR